MNNFQNSKLIAGYITHFKPEDFKAFTKFLKSPYHNSNQKLVQLLEIIEQRSPDFGHKNFTKEKVYEKLRPKLVYREKSFQKLTTDMIKKVEAFQAHEKLKEDELLKEELRHKYLSDRNEYAKFKDSSMEEIKKLEKKKNKKVEDFGWLLKFNHYLSFHPETPRDAEWVNKHIRGCMDTLDYLYFFLKLTYGVELLTRNNLQDQKYKIKLLDEAIHLSKQTKLNENVSFNLYVLLIAFLKAKDEKTYKNLKGHLFEKHKDISKKDQSAAGKVMVNYVYQKYLDNGVPHLRELAILHKFRDRQNLFIINGRIPVASFINVINVIAASGDFEWTTNFMDKYAPYLKENSTEDVLCFCRACIQFYKKDYLDAIAELKDIEKKPLYINIRFRSLSIRAYYELSLIHDRYDDETEKSIRRFKAYLPGKNLHADREAAYKNFCSVCLDLLYGKKEKALKKIKLEKNLMFRPWLREKAEQLK